MAYYNFSVLIDLLIMVYELIYSNMYASTRTAGELKYCNFLGVIIPPALVGYEIVIASAPLAIYHLISIARARGIIVLKICYLKLLVLTFLLAYYVNSIL